MGLGLLGYGIFITREHQPLALSSSVFPFPVGFSPIITSENQFPSAYISKDK